MNPYEILGVTDTTPVVELHLAYIEKRKALVEQQWTILDLPADASAKAKQDAWLRKLDAVDPRKSDGPREVDETWSENQRAIDELDNAYNELCSKLTPCQIMNVTPDATIQDLLIACGKLIEQGIGTSAVAQAFTDQFVILNALEFRTQERERTMRPSMFGPHPSRYEGAEIGRDIDRELLMRRGAYREESYQLWTRLTLAYNRR
jgi:hypothetical protein